MALKQPTQISYWMWPIKSTSLRICWFKQKMPGCTMSNVHHSSDSLTSREIYWALLLISRKDLLRIYTNLNKLNEDLASSYQIRKQNFIEMQKSLDAVNSVLKSSIRLRGEQIYWFSNELAMLNKWLNFSGKLCGQNDATVQSGCEK